MQCVIRIEYKLFEKRIITCYFTFQRQNHQFGIWHYKKNPSSGRNCLGESDKITIRSVFLNFNDFQYSLDVHNRDMISICVTPPSD